MKKLRYAIPAIVVGVIIASAAYANQWQTVPISASGQMLWAGALNASGTITQNGTAVLTGNQSITFTASGDATGTASGATSLTPTLHVSSIQGVSVISTAPTTGDVLEYNGSQWVHNPTSTILAGYSTSTPSSLAGVYLGTSGSSLTVSSTLASGTIQFSISNATTTTGYNMSPPVLIPSNGTVTSAFCIDNAGTSTILIWRQTAYSATTSTADIVSSLSCGIAGGSTTSFGTSTLISGNYLRFVVSSTVGTSQTTGVGIWYTKK